MKLQWTTSDIDPKPFFTAARTLNSVQWKSFDAECAIIDSFSFEKKNAIWHITVIVLPASPPLLVNDVDGSVVRINAYAKTDFATVIPGSAVEV